MDHTRKRTPSLIPLESALIAAEKLTPSHAPRPGLDPNEKLAALLIERIKHPQHVPLPPLPIGVPEPCIPTLKLEMAGRDG